MTGPTGLTAASLRVKALAAWRLPAALGDRDKAGSRAGRDEQARDREMPDSPPASVSPGTQLCVVASAH